MMMINENLKVVKEESTASSLNPLTAIEIAVDTSYVASQNGNNISQGIYMMDNQEANGSTGEGTLELHTCCNVGSLIGFKCVPINALGTTGDKVEITGFTISQGSVFSAAGQPIKQSDGSYWIGQALNTGTQTYQVQIKVTVGILHPVSYFVNWDPFITAQ